MDRRQRLRQSMQNLRSVLDSQEAARRSGLICTKLARIPVLNNARIIMAYAAFGREVDINPYWQEQIRMGKRILLPRVRGDQLEAVEFVDWEETTTGSFGIREPLGEAFQLEEIDVVLVPGLVFDRTGNRLGYGKGYYDRFLARLMDASFFCGIAYHFQLVEDAFPAARDVQLHAVVTDEELIWSQAGNSTSQLNSGNGSDNEEATHDLHAG